MRIYKSIYTIYKSIYIVYKSIFIYEWVYINPFHAWYMHVASFNVWYSTLWCWSIRVVRPICRTEQCSAFTHYWCSLVGDVVSMASSWNKSLTTPLGLLVKYVIYKHPGPEPMALWTRACKSHIALAGM